MYDEDRVDKVAEPERRAFTYLALSTVRFAYASFARLLVAKFIATWNPSADVLALAFAEFDLSEIEMGKTVTVTWRGKPIFIRKRAIAALASCSLKMDDEMGGGRGGAIVSGGLQKMAVKMVAGVCWREENTCEFGVHLAGRVNMKVVVNF